MFETIIPTLALTALVAPAFAAENWSTDLPAALEQAAAENKLALVDFNGSDWCGPCITLKKKVFDTAAFLAYAKDKFILVDIDLPSKKKMSPELRAANEALSEQYAVTGFLSEQYAVTGFPSVFVMNSQGIVVGGFVGGNDSVPAVQAMLDVAIANAAKVGVALNKAASLKGVEQAKALYAAYQMVPAELQASNTKLMIEIKALDSEDSLGFAKAAAAKKALDAEVNRIMASFSGLRNNYKAIIELVSKELESDKHDADLRSFLNSVKLNAMLISSESVADIAEAKAFALSFAKTLPYPDSALVLLEKTFSEPEKLLERVKASRAKREASQK